MLDHIGDTRKHELSDRIDFRHFGHSSCDGDDPRAVDHDNARMSDERDLQRRMAMRIELDRSNFTVPVIRPVSCQLVSIDFCRHPERSGDHVHLFLAHRNPARLFEKFESSSNVYQRFSADHVDAASEVQSA